MSIKTPQTGIISSDFRRDFLQHPIKKNLINLTNEQSVISSIKNLMLTGPYERRFRPSIGAGLQKYLFEQVTPVTASLIRTSIIRCIQTFEKSRVALLNVNVIVNDDYNSYSATITFRIINKNEPITFTTILERVR